MYGSGIQSVEIVLLLLLLFVAGFTLLARKLQIPYPIVLVVAGLILSRVPGIPRVTLNPDLVFLVVLPPLLFAGAWLTSWRDFVDNLVSISFLAFGLVGFTVLGVAGTAHVAFPGFDWRLGVVLGAVVATRMRLPLPPLPNVLACRSAWLMCWKAKACSMTPLDCWRWNLAWQSSLPDRRRRLLPGS
jgi:hypothetical protein